MLSAWLKKIAAEVRRLGAVCVGAFLLAEAGLLNDRRATTHWRFGREMATRYPRVLVQHDPLWVKDGNIYTSAGISAGIDLAPDLSSPGRRGYEMLTRAFAEENLVLRVSGDTVALAPAP